MAIIWVIVQWFERFDLLAARVRTIWRASPVPLHSRYNRPISCLTSLPAGCRCRQCWPELSPSQIHGLISNQSKLRFDWDSPHSGGNLDNCRKIQFSYVYLFHERIVTSAIFLEEKCNYYRDAITITKKRNDLALLTAAFHVQQIFVSENSTEQIGDTDFKIWWSHLEICQ